MTNRRRLRFYLPLPLLAVAALVWPLSRPEPTHRTAGEIAYHGLPDKPAGDMRPGRVGVEPTAIATAAWLKAVPAAKGSDAPCAQEDLYVSWTEPPATIELGNFIPPLGPEPTATTDAVNGIVQCKGSEAYAFMGFQARYTDEKWDVLPTPADVEDDLPEVTAPEPQAPDATPAPAVTLDGRTFGAAVEGLAAYEPQRTCSSTAKVGTTAMRNLLLKDNAGTRNLGIVRGCGVGGTSEHKEGRAFDWGVNVHNAREKAEADAFTAKLIATDEHGNKYALARRMGVMYVIWNQRIWSAYRADEGWRPYHGASAHTDHVHISLSWAGAQARTSFWSGNVVEVLLASAPSELTRAVRTASGAGKARVAKVSTDQVADDAARRAKREADRAATHAAWEAKRAKWEADREAAKLAHEQQDALDDAARDAARAEAKAKWEADKVERQATREADDAARELARQEATEKAAADKAARDAARAAAAQAYADKRAVEQAARDAARQAATEQATADRAARAQAAADKAAADTAARDAARQAATEKAAADKAARDAARQAAAEKAAAERAAREEARRHRSTTTTTAPRPSTTTTEPAPTTTAPATTTTTEG
ncbi:MAG: hypothetical protein JWO68_2879 [Actinomycetia bacterium]|nr:hypothetical protein [Actinomycetes bacterium]